MSASKYHVYILTNKSFTLYVGVTNNLPRRIFEHKNKTLKGFTRKYNINKLIYSEEFTNTNEALAREKQIFSGNKKRGGENSATPSGAG